MLTNTTFDCHHVDALWTNINKDE